MCYTLTFESIRSGCALLPKHVVQTKFYWVCDELLAESAEADAGANVGEADADANDNVSTTANSEDSDDEFETAPEYPIVTPTTSASTSPAVSPMSPTAPSFESSVTSISQTVEKHCDDEDCIPLGIFGSARSKGPCTYCDGTEREEPIIIVLRHRDAFVTGLIQALSSE